jgi:hypothetical protein
MQLLGNRDPRWLLTAICLGLSLGLSLYGALFKPLPPDLACYRSYPSDLMPNRIEVCDAQAFLGRRP